MRKTVLFLTLAAGLLACSKEPFQQEETSAGEPMHFEINVTGTKAAKTSWEDGDEIVLFFKGIENNYILFSYNEETQEWDERISYDTFTSSDFENLEENILSAVHLPGISSITIEDGYFSFFGKDEKPIFNYYLAQTGVPYTVDGTTVSASFTMEKPEGFVQFHVAGIEKTVDNYTFASPQVRPVALSGINFDGTLREEVLQAGARLSGFADADGAVFAGQLTNPGVTADYVFTVADDDGIYTMYRDSRTLEAGKMYNFPALTVTGPDNWNHTAASDLYVDLGLSVKWAKWNLGATKPEEYGDYFAWGEIAPKSVYNWTTYNWMQEGQSDWKHITKYTFSDNGFMYQSIWFDGETFLGDNGDGVAHKDLASYEYEDDAARANWSGSWRIPTPEEWKELLDTKSDTEKYSWTWCDGSTTKYDDTEVKGWIIERKADNATVFFPATGNREGADLSLVGTGGYYWSSSLGTNSDNAQCMYFFSSSVSIGEGNSRFLGYSVRPVSD